MNIELQAIENGIERLKAYRKYGFPIESLRDTLDNIRWEASLFYNEFNNLDSSLFYQIRYYRKFGYNAKAFSSEYPQVRLEAYETLGFTPASREDSDFYIRIGAYRYWGYTKEAFKDYENAIRVEAYIELGFTKEALSDPDPMIVKLAKRYFKLEETTDESS